MAVYLVTGNLGGGKSLMSVQRMKDYLLRGSPVATNLDIRLHHMLGSDHRTARLYRIPDKPCLDDFIMLGKGNTTYDEDKNGLIVLDECGTWFNSRSWGDKSRQPMIDWLLHSRKYGWDLILIIQNVALIDKQARLAIGEHVVYCKRTDRMNIPIIGNLLSLIWGGKLPLPKIHIGVVKYGLLPTAMTVDTWTSYGTGLYLAYDTKQRFSEFYDKGVHSMLPPYYTHGRYKAARTLRSYMRLTKIYFKKWSRVAVFAAGMVVCFVLTEAVASRSSNDAVDPVSTSKAASIKDSSSSVDDELNSGDDQGGDQVARDRGGDPPPDPEIIEVELNYTLSKKGFIIGFDGSVYTAKSFPYPLTWRDKTLFALLPSDIASSLQEQKAARFQGLQAAGGLSGRSSGRPTGSL